jgi:alpha-tubulin suppressor-like RCC1 family protein
VSVPGIDDATAVDVTLGHLAIARRSGDIVAWGQHKDGIVAGALSARVADVAQLRVNGSGYGCALDRAGRVRCWGSSVAHRSATRRWEVAEVLGDAVDLSSWEDVACAVKRDGSVWCWSDGSDNWAQVGTKPSARDDLRDAVEVAVGGHHACARRSDAAVVCWGDNEMGQLGRGHYQRDPNAAPVVDLAGAAALGAGETHTCAVIEGGSIACWGHNASGQLGDGKRGGTPTTSSDEPLVVAGLASLR